MSSTKSQYRMLLKSQLAGFFALLLVGCSPQKEPVSQQQLMEQAATKPQAAMKLAKQRLADSELNEALNWFRQAARLGDSEGLNHALELQQRLEGRLATAKWLQQVFESDQLPASAISRSQRATLGLWQSAPATVPDSGYQAAAGCNLTVQPIVSQQAGIVRWQHLKSAWATDPLLSSLPVCFNELLKVNATELSCSEHAAERISCNYGSLTEQVLAGEFSQLLIIAGQGLASYNNGIVQLPDTASLALLQHEFMHVLGFIDEYPLSHIAAEKLCHPGSFATNLLFDSTPATVAAWRQQWLPETEAASDKVKLAAVETCQAAGQQAYRVVATINPMESYQTAMPELYQQLMVRALNSPENIMPVQYYFAYLARQQQAWQQWHALMQLAAGHGYGDAVNALQHL
ncbi:hypothetical protein SAMN06297280_2567 [Arsukibacterium tuosuense]|uniref:Uncharacterized protein n=1 Tax=Arsukibacterium tuosuense TaxID=1323745 RepID=A0A285J1H3_9GAMM|nr:hypothetical protein [Arsukibacterium tuosuense]SNY54104.1 hypothetical protein SAMN06297280_2567 [Arsukibacterium tuosuense]